MVKFINEPYFEISDENLRFNADTYMYYKSLYSSEEEIKQKLSGNYNNYFNDYLLYSEFIKTYPIWEIHHDGYVSTRKHIDVPNKKFVVNEIFKMNKLFRKYGFGLAGNCCFVNKKGKFVIEIYRNYIKCTTI